MAGTCKSGKKIENKKKDSKQTAGKKRQKSTAFKCIVKKMKQQIIENFMSICMCIVLYTHNCSFVWKMLCTSAIYSCNYNTIVWSLSNSSKRCIRNCEKKQQQNIMLHFSSSHQNIFILQHISCLHELHIYEMVYARSDDVVDASILYVNRKRRSLMRKSPQ